MMTQMAQLIDGKAISKAIRAEIKEEVARLTADGLTPGLAVVIVGEDPASEVYVRNKAKACESCGLYSEVHRLPEETTQAELLALVDKLNRQDNLHGILVQLPLPKHIDSDAVIEAIAPEKDVDAFSPINVGKIVINNFTLAPCTPAGVIELIKRSGIEISGQNCVIIGRSNIVGKPLAMLMLHNNATVTICHTRTRDLPGVAQQADILVAAVGRPNFVTGDMIKPGAVVIDVGVNRLEDGTLCGDVDFAAAEPLASYITLVPGGVGPMTIAMLLKNTVEAAKALR